MDDACVQETGFGALLTREEEVKKNELIHKLAKLNVKTSKINDQIIDKDKEEGNNAPSQKEELYRENEDWSPTAISSLLDACSHFSKNATVSSKLSMDCVWKEIASEVSGRSKGSRKPKDVEQCKGKFRTMLGRFNREKMAKKFNPNECNSWEWYSAMNSIFVDNPHFMANPTIDAKTTKQNVGINNDVLSPKTICDVNNKHIEKVVLEPNMSKKSPNDISRKSQSVEENGNIETNCHENGKLVQYTSPTSPKSPITSISPKSPITPISPKSPRSLIKVKWRDSNLPQKTLIEKFEETQGCEDNVTRAKALDLQDVNENHLKINEIKEVPLDAKQGTINDSTLLDRKGKGTLRSFDSYSDNSTSCSQSDTTDQNSISSSPVVLRSSQPKSVSSKHNDTCSSDKDSADPHIGRLSVIKLSRSINSNYKRTCVKNITNIKHGNEINVYKEIESKPESYTVQKARLQDQNSATSIVSNEEQVDISIARSDLEEHSSKMFPKGNSLESLTSQSESSCSSKQKKRLHVFSKYKYARRYQSSRTLMTTLMRTSNSTPHLKKHMRPFNRAFLAQEPNMVTALMTFGAMIQQLEKNHINLMERTLNEQSNILKNFVKTLKYNHQVREATMVGLVVRFLLSIFLVGAILFGTSKTTSSWIPLGFESSSWYRRNLDDNFTQVVWIGCFIIVLFTQILWTSFKRRPTTPSQSL